MGEAVWVVCRPPSSSQGQKVLTGGTEASGEEKLPAAGEGKTWLFKRNWWIQLYVIYIMVAAVSSQNIIIIIIA